MSAEKCEIDDAKQPIQDDGTRNHKGRERNKQRQGRKMTQPEYHGSQNVRRPDHCIRWFPIWGPANEASEPHKERHHE